MLNYFILVLGIIIPITLLLLLYVIRLARKRALVPSEKSKADRLQRIFSDLSQSFHSAVANLENSLKSRLGRYRIPLVLLVGNDNANKSDLITYSGIERARSIDLRSEKGVGVGWNYFKRGLVLDVSAECFGEVGDRSNRLWQKLLQLIEKYRLKRPIDGIILTISAEEMLDAENCSTEKMHQIGEAACYALRQAQTRFGLRFPVYVVITRSECIPGFNEFVRALPTNLRDGIVGWSNPNELDLGYQSRWIAEALSETAQSIATIQAELLAEDRASIEETAAFVLFPRQIFVMQQALQAYLDKVFSASAFHENLFFRGLYFTGDINPLLQASAIENPEAIVLANADNRLEELPQPAAWAHDFVFVKDLFELKIFAEFGLARTSHEASSRRNRKVKALWWGTVTIALLWVATLFIQTYKIESTIQTYQELMGVIVEAVEDREAVTRANHQLDTTWYKRKTTLMLEKVSNLGSGNLWVFGMPGSLPIFTSLHDDMRKVIEAGFQGIVFNTVRQGLNIKVSELTGVKIKGETSEFLVQGDMFSSATGAANQCTDFLNGGADIAPTNMTLANFPGFELLVSRLSEITTLEKNLAAFNRLRDGQAEAKDLSELLSYTWDIQLPRRILGAGQHTHLFKQKLFFSTVLPDEVLKANADCSLLKSIDLIGENFFKKNIVLRAAKDILARTDAQAVRGPGEAVNPFEKSLLGQIDSLEQMLARTESGWLAAGESELGSQYEAMLNAVSASPSLGPKVSEKMREKISAQIETLQNDLSALSSPELGKLLIRNENKSFSIAPAWVGFRTSLGLFLNQQFMADSEGGSLETRIDPRTVVRWNVKHLEEAIAMAGEQRRFLKENTAKFPLIFQDKLTVIANRRLGVRMTDLVAKAQSLAAELGSAKIEGVETNQSLQNNEFDKNGGQLLRLLMLFKEIGATETHEDLTGLLKRDALRSLVAIKQKLDNSEFYSIRDGNFSWWQGGLNPALGAFRVQDPQELAGLLGYQQAQIESLAAISVPLLAFIDSTGIKLDGQALSAARSMRMVVRELERFKTKAPQGSIAELEAFIRSDLVEIDGQNCIEKLSSKMGQSRNPDFFKERLSSIRQGLYSRCAEIAISDVRQFFLAMGKKFEVLKGRFPFGPAQGGRGEAAFDDVVEFFKLYDQHIKLVQPFIVGRKLATGTVSAPTSAERDVAARFIEQTSILRTFLAPLLPQDDMAILQGYDISVEYRVNQSAEIDGNKIVDWSLEVGDQVLKLRDQQRSVHWRPGQPITFNLRWAKDAPGGPIIDGASQHMSVDGKTVSYRFNGDWALIKLLKLHGASPEAPSRMELRPHLLKFEFATVGVGALPGGRASMSDSRVRVFIRALIMPGAKKDILMIPIFPVDVPALTREQTISRPLSGVSELSRSLNRSGAMPNVTPGTRQGWPDGYGGIFSERLPLPKLIPRAKKVEAP